MPKKIILLFFICCFQLLPSLFAQVPPDEIVRKVDAVRNPQADYTVSVQVTSYSAKGSIKQASYEVLVKGSDKTLIKTILPEVERGRVLLMRGNDLWAYFPDVSKPLRLSMQERLIGDVANGDIARVNFSGDYNAKLLQVEKIAGKQYYVLELSAKTPEVTYSKAILWAQMDSFWPLKAEFYALSGRLLKTCSYEAYKMLAGSLRPTELVMQDPIVKGKKSIIKYENIQVAEIPEKYFSKDYMKKQEEIASLPAVDRNVPIGDPNILEMDSSLSAKNDKTIFSGLKQEVSIRSEFASRISEPHDITKLKNQGIITETGKLSDNLRFKVSGRFYYDAVYDATDNFAKNVESDQESEIELRDTYLDYSRGSFDVRLGKQQIVWGEAVGLFFADVVNAKDLREFVLPDFDLIRIPQWGMDAEYSKENFHSEFVFLPIAEFNKLGVSGSEFVFPYPVPENTSYSGLDPDAPANSLKNSEGGLRLSYLLNGWDIGAFYFYSWEKSPVMYRAIQSGAYRFSPEYKRQNMFGATFAKEVNDIVFKGEFVYKPKGYFSILDSADSDGVIRKDFVDYLLGLDYTIFGGIDTNIQFMQRVIFSYDGLLFNEKEVNNSISFWASKDLLNSALKCEFLVISSLMEKDLMYRPSFTYSFRNNWKWKAGLDIFQGEANGIFGKFNKKDRVYTELSYYF